MAEKQFENVVLIIKNGSTAGWQNTSYRLQKGELGICYLDNGNIIVKAGKDGQTPWADLPQVEGVFEDDLTLTYAFGKYAPDSTGSFTLKSSGKTMGEVMLDAFAQEVYENLITARPSMSFTVSGSKDAEVGTAYSKPVATLTLNTNGSYKYGAKGEDGVKGNAKISFTSANIKKDNASGEVLKSLADLSGNTITYTQEIPTGAVVGDTAVTYTFYAEAAHGEDANRPLTNLGNFVTKDSEGNYCGTKTFSQAIGQIPATTLGAKSAQAKMTGYRKMFIGTTSNAAPTVDSAFIRSLNKVSEKAAKTTKTFTATAGEIGFYIAIPTSLTTTAPTVNYKFFGEWKALSGVTALGETVNVEGANGYEAKPYKVYKYVPESGSFDANTEIQVIIR